MRGMENPDCLGCRELTARVLELEDQVRTLTAQLRDLMDKLKPPLKPTVRSHTPAPAKTPTGRKPGG